MARREIGLPLRAIAKVDIFDMKPWPHRRSLVGEAVARRRQLAPNPIQVRVGTETGDQPGKAIAPLSRAQVAPQAHYDEWVIGRRLREGHHDQGRHADTRTEAKRFDPAWHIGRTS